MRERGEILLSLALICAIVGAAWAWVSPSVGTYQIASDGQGIVRMDTRTGKMERVAP